MKASELFSGISVLSWGKVDPASEITGVTSDSRKIRPGDAFVCLVGKRFDGRLYIPDAMRAGAAIAVCMEQPEGEVPCVIVEDTRPVLPLLLANFYHHPERSFRRIIGITGTNGKTTTSFMLKAIFEKAGCKTGLIGTTKYLIGDEEYPTPASDAFLTTPDPELLYALFDAMRFAGVDTVIMEASSHSLALKKLTGIPFDFALFTNLTQDHLDFHESMESYLAAKKSLFQMARVGVFNCDDPAFAAISESVKASVVTFSAKGNAADFSATALLSHTPHGIRFRAATKDGETEIFVPIPGLFTVSNALGAYALARCAGIEEKTILEALFTMHGVKGRIERVPTDTPYSVFIDFAHTPDALENILTTLRTFTEGRLICLFGCGGDRDRAKRPIMGRIACEKSDLVIVTSDNSRSEKKEDIIADILEGVRGSKTPLVAITDRTEAIQWALGNAAPGDVILLAGKGHEEYEIDQAGKHDYSERKIVLEFVKRRNETK